MDFFDYQARTRRFERLAAYNNYADATLTGAGEPERIAGTRVTADFLSVLHVTPLIGRDFRREDDQPGATGVAILTHGFWTRRFADPSIVGRSDLEREYPNTNAGESVTIAPLLEAMVGGARSTLLILLGTVVFVLLIACANLAHLLLARSTSRRKEIAVLVASKDVTVTVIAARQHGGS